MARPVTSLGRREHLADGEAARRAEVAGERRAAARRRPGAGIAGDGRLEQRGQVRVREVGDVDVVADRGTVGRRVVVAEQRQRRAALRREQDVRDQVRLRPVDLAQPLVAPATLK